MRKGPGLDKHFDLTSVSKGLLALDAATVVIAIPADSALIQPLSNQETPYVLCARSASWCS
jgi:hypothetical protein